MISCMISYHDSATFQMFKSSRLPRTRREVHIRMANVSLFFRTTPPAGPRLLQLKIVQVGGRLAGQPRPPGGQTATTLAMRSRRLGPGPVQPKSGRVTVAGDAGPGPGPGAWSDSGRPSRRSCFQVQRFKFNLKLPVPWPGHLV